MITDTQIRELASVIARHPLYLSHGEITVDADDVAHVVVKYGQGEDHGGGRRAEQWERYDDEWCLVADDPASPVAETPTPDPTYLEELAAEIDDLGEALLEVDLSLVDLARVTDALHRMAALEREAQGHTARTHRTELEHGWAIETTYGHACYLYDKANQDSHPGPSAQFGPKLATLGHGTTVRIESWLSDWSDWTTAVRREFRLTIPDAHCPYWREMPANHTGTVECACGEGWDRVAIVQRAPTTDVQLGALTDTGEPQVLVRALVRCPNCTATGWTP